MPWPFLSNLLILKLIVTERTVDEIEDPYDDAKVDNTYYSGQVVSWGTSVLEMQEAGLRLMNGAARWVFKRLDWPPELPAYEFDAFARYVSAFVELWLDLRVTPACNRHMQHLRQIVEKAADDLREISPDGVARLPKVSTDEGLHSLYAKIQKLGVGDIGLSKTGIFGTMRTEENAPDCSGMDESLRKRFCATRDGEAGWRFWFDEWLPSLIDALSCGWETDASAWASWEHAGAIGAWDVQSLQVNASIRESMKTGDETLVFKAWRLVFQYLSNPDFFAFEAPSQYQQKELGRFVPFIGEALDRRDLEATTCAVTKAEASNEQLHATCSPQLFHLLNFQGTERQPFYGPHVWRFLHTVAERVAETGKLEGEVKGMALLESFKTFFNLFAGNHPCPHCRAHLNLKVKHSDADSYDGNKLLLDHKFREYAGASRIFQESDEILLYPLEWLTLAGQESGHIFGSNLHGWHDVRLLNVTGLDAKLRSLKKTEDLRIFIWKLHNAVDSSIESKYEERCAPWPTSYWPVSERYRASEPWSGPVDEAAVPFAAAYSWANFKVSLARKCRLDATGRESTGTAIGSTIFPLTVSEDGLSEVEKQHLQVLSGSSTWRALWLAYLKLAQLLHSDEQLLETLSCKEGSCQQAAAALRERIRLPSDASRPDAIITVESKDLQEALAHWLADWSLWSRLLRQLEETVECVAQFVMESRLLQIKFSLHRGPDLSELRAS